MTGDPANWTVPCAPVKGMGGPIYPVAGAGPGSGVMDHVRKKGEPKLLESWTLPLTSRHVASRVMIDLGRCSTWPAAR